MTNGKDSSVPIKLTKTVSRTDSTVKYRVIKADGSAKPGVNFEEVKSGEITFLKDETEKSLTVKILNDEIEDFDESVNFFVFGLLCLKTYSHESGGFFLFCRRAFCQHSHCSGRFSVVLGIFPLI